MPSKIGSNRKSSSENMKKTLIVTLFLGSLSFCGLHAQKGGTKSSAETSEHGTGSTAKSKGVSKGSPLLQRNAAAPAASEAEAKPQESMEPAAAPGGKAVLAPASPPAPANPEAAAVKGESGVSVKPAKVGVSEKPKPAEAPKN
jgi:hypothetical protein